MPISATFVNQYAIFRIVFLLQKWYFDNNNKQQWCFSMMVAQKLHVEELILQKGVRDDLFIGRGMAGRYW